MRTIQHFRPDTPPQRGTVRLRPGVDRRTLEAFVPGVTAKMYDFRDDLQASTGNDIGDASVDLPGAFGLAIFIAGVLVLPLNPGGGIALIGAALIVGSQAQAAEDDGTEAGSETDESEGDGADKEASEEEGGAIDVVA